MRPSIEMVDRLRPLSSPLALIELAYASAEDPERLPDFLLGLADVVGGRAAVLVEHDLAAHAALPVQVRCNPAATADYVRYYCRIDPLARSPRLRTVAAPGEAFVDQMLLPYGELQQTEFHNDWSLKHDYSRWLGVCFSLDARGYSGIAIARAHRDGAFGRDELATMSAVAPHARRAADLRRLLGRAHQTAAAALEALDRRAVGVILVGGDGRVDHANAEALRILKARDGLADQAGILTAAGTTAMARLRALIADAAGAPEDGRGTGGALAVTRPSGKRAFQLSVLPAPARHPLSLSHDAASAIVLVSDPEVTEVPAPERLQQAYALSDAEAKVAVLMARGADAKDIAAALRYTRATATWYVARVLDKAGQPTRAAFVAAAAALERASDDGHGS